MNTRRDFLYGLGATVGTVALNAMMASDARADDVESAPDEVSNTPHVRPLSGRESQALHFSVHGGWAFTHRHV